MQLATLVLCSSTTISFMPLLLLTTVLLYGIDHHIMPVCYLLALLVDYLVPLGSGVRVQ